jgi:type III secretory pathway component EscS
MPTGIQPQAIMFIYKQLFVSACIFLAVGAAPVNGTYLPNPFVEALAFV